MTTKARIQRFETPSESGAFQGNQHEVTGLGSGIHCSINHEKEDTMRRTILSVAGLMLIASAGRAWAYSEDDTDTWLGARPQSVSKMEITTLPSSGILRDLIPPLGVTIVSSGHMPVSLTPPGTTIVSSGDLPDTPIPRDSGTFFWAMVRGTTKPAPTNSISTIAYPVVPAPIPSSTGNLTTGGWVQKSPDQKAVMAGSGPAGGPNHSKPGERIV
jgi:hypothetical protein